MGRWITKNGAHIWLKEDKLYKSIKDHYTKEEFSNPQLDSNEETTVRHEINNWCNIYTPKSKYKKGGTYIKAVGDYIYTFRIIDYNDYEFLDKIPIDK